MPDAMQNRGKFWTPAPDWRAARLEGEGWHARRIHGLGQTLLSGDLDAARAALAPGAGEVGLWGLAGEGACAVRIARDRALLVSPSPLAIAPGWRAGFIATPCDDGHAVLEISGPGMPQIVAEGTAADLAAGSRSASVLFAGVSCLLYRAGPDRARLHVESPLAAYIWTWLGGWASELRGRPADSVSGIEGARE